METKEQECPVAPISKTVGFLWLLFLFLGGYRRLVLKLEKKDCGISARVAGEVIYPRLQLKQK